MKGITERPRPFFQAGSLGTCLTYFPADQPILGQHCSHLWLFQSTRKAIPAWRRAQAEQIKPGGLSYSISGCLPARVKSEPKGCKDQALFTIWRLQAERRLVLLVKATSQNSGETHTTASLRQNISSVRSIRPAASGPSQSDQRNGPDAASALIRGSAGTEGPYRVFVCALPLEGWEMAERMLGRQYPDALALHTLIVLQDPDGSCIAFDFLPLEPTSPFTASRLMTGGTVAANVRTRQLKRLPSRRCWAIGTAPADALEVASAFQQTWRAELQLFRRDCRHHTSALAAALCIDKPALEQLPGLNLPPSA